jgi:hypothetical protein
MVCKVDTRGILVRARTALCPVGSTAARVALHRSACNWDYKLSREGADPKSLQGMWECVVCFGWSLFKKILSVRCPVPPLL